MALKVCFCASSLLYPEGGGHLWQYLNWALGFRALGCELIWLESPSPSDPPQEVQEAVAILKGRLQRYGLSPGGLALCSSDTTPLLKDAQEGCLDLDAASEANLLVNQMYDLPLEVVSRFRRSALLDIDPGLTQIWMSTGLMNVPKHDVYFTTGETVGQPGSPIPDCGLRWHYTPPAVFLPAWPPTIADATAPFTTVSHWYGKEWVDHAGQSYHNNKRDGFLPLLGLPRRTAQSLELALCLDPEEEKEEWRMLRARGWRVRDAHKMASTPWDYQRYIQGSRGEFSCCKPVYKRLQTAWIGDRTICYLASGKPAVVQHTGPSTFLPDCAGLFRFRTMKEAVSFLDRATSDYERQGRHARALAEEYFDAEKLARRVLERALE